jgi:uncharacterized protein YkwD
LALRYATTVVVAATILATAAAVGVSSSEPERAEAASAATVTSCTGGDITLSAAEKRSLDLHNGARKDRGLRALCVHPALQKAARAYSQDMLDRDYFDHTSPDGETVKQRLERFGYDFSDCPYCAYGENIALGSGSQGSPKSAFDFWMHSPDHRSNILNEKFRQVGIGARTGTFKSYDRTTTYTVDFGVRRH